jgi:hypothetical protein
MDVDGRSRVRALGEILDTQVDPALRQRIRNLVDQQVRREQPQTPGPTGVSLKPGEVGPQRVLDPKELTSLVRRAVSGDQRRLVWNHRGNETTVRLDSLRIATADGLIMVGLTLETDQTDAQELTTVFAVGSTKQPAGLLAVAEERPRGHGDLAATFAEPVIATCWRGLLLVITAVAAAAGRDASGDPLTPVALTATADGLIVHTIADHRLGRG